MSNIDLKSCPLCGGRAIYDVNSFMSSHHFMGIDFQIKCEKCGLTHPKMFKIRMDMSDNGKLNISQDDRPLAAETWNRRNK